MSSRLNPSTAITHSGPVSWTRSTNDAVAARYELIVALVLQIVTALYLSTYVSRGWFPSDEGVIAHSAERVLQGELPHRDFDSPYTGGLSILHAGVFSLLGESLLSLRWSLFVFAQLFVAAFYLLARRCLSIKAAVTVTLMAVVWGLPVYFAAMPSWYVLFLEVIATVCVVRFIDSSNRNWLICAGVLCGLGFLLKITVLYYVAAVLLLILFRIQSLNCDNQHDQGRMAVTVLTLCISLALSLMVTALLSRCFDSRVACHLLLPNIAVCSVLVLNERNSVDSLKERVCSLLRDALPFVIGAAVPVILFTALYVPAGSLSQLWHGVFIVPQQRFESVPWPLPPLFWMLTVVPLMAVLYLKTTDIATRRVRCLVIVVLTSFLCLVHILSNTPLVFNSVWASVRCASPFVVAVGCWLCLKPNQYATEPAAAIRRQVLFLFTAATSLTSLVQFPNATNPYFLYFAPFMILTAVYAAHQQCAGIRFQHVAMAGFYLCFGLLTLNRTYVANPTLELFSEHQYEMDSSRSGLLLSKQDRDVYSEIIRLVQLSTSPDEFIYAAPDCPEVYFLANRQNPTRTMYDVFDDHDGRFERLIEVLDDQKTGAVVVNMAPLYSSKAAPELRQAIIDRFPVVQQVGSFVVALRRMPDSES